MLSKQEGRPSTPLGVTLKMCFPFVLVTPAFEV